MRRIRRQIAVMTPEMSAADLSFARRTETMEGYLTRYWYWGRRDRITIQDPEEAEYEACYGVAVRSPGAEVVTSEHDILDGIALSLH